MELQFFIGFILGGALSFLASWLFFLNRKTKELQSFQNEKLELEKSLATAQAENRELHHRLDLHKKDIEEIKQRMVLELSQAHHQSLQQSAQQLSQSSKNQMETVLAPFQNQLKELQERIHKTYDQESRERLSLQEQIKMIVQTHEKMTFETASLTKALRGESRAQGNWGELTLKRVLEASGLREGHEYQEQGKGFGFRDEQGVLRKPDYLILLPENRQIVIDSKVVLNSFEKYMQAEAEAEKVALRKEYMASIQRHIEDLAKKDYTGLHGINSPDFTLMFLPSDGAYLLAIQAEEQIQQKAFAQKVVLTSPSLLLPLLRTVEFVWRQDRQGKNAETIGLSAGRLYDKFVGLLEDLDKVKNQMQASEQSLDEAFSKLKFGKGNLVSRIEKLRKLGAKVKKPIAETWLEEGSEGEEENSQEDSITEPLPQRPEVIS
ncbi:MAG: DNA recombination protein RmuC [Bdellovibrionales bacterium]|nr:DNA recombination protein RmuC [Bdellovibrionales bacterium]